MDLSVESWSSLEHGLTEWEGFCQDIDCVDSNYFEDQDSHATLHATLRSMARLLANNQRSQAMHGKATSLLARQVVSCMKGSETAVLKQTVQVPVHWKHFYVNHMTQK